MIHIDSHMSDFVSLLTVWQTQDLFTLTAYGTRSTLLLQAPV